MKMAIDNLEFTVMAKRYAVDDTVKACVNELKSPRVLKRSPELSGLMKDDFSRRLDERTKVQQLRADWFNRFTQDEQRLMTDILEECAELVLLNFFCLIDGVGGSYGGVFEIVAVDGDERTVVNPENTEMLHDLFSEACEKD
jgi:hypothetical protein